MVQEATTVTAVAEAQRTPSKVVLGLLLPVRQQQQRLAILRKTTRTGRRWRRSQETTR